jgi:hypothetical protein
MFVYFCLFSLGIMFLHLVSACFMDFFLFLVRLLLIFSNWFPCMKLITFHV